MLQGLQGTVPIDWLVLVLADRGLYARWLYGAIVRRGWHPFMRINLTVKAKPAGAEHFDWLSRSRAAPWEVVARNDGVLGAVQESAEMYAALAVGTRP